MSFLTAKNPFVLYKTTRLCHTSGMTVVEKKTIKCRGMTIDIYVTHYRLVTKKIKIKHFGFVRTNDTRCYAVIWIMV